MSLSALDTISKILLELSANKAAPILKSLGYRVSPSNCLRIVKKHPIPEPKELKIIGIDDWAIRKGVSYGSVVVDLESGRAVDLIPSRETNVVSEWLSRHPTIEIVTRDRATAYSAAIKEALPDAKQIADKFHIACNLGDKIYEEIVTQYNSVKKDYITSLNAHKGLDDIISDNSELQYTESNNRSLLRLERAKSLMEQIKVCKSEGLSMRATAKVLGKARCTIIRYWDLEEPIISPIYYANNYGDYLSDIVAACERGVNVKSIHAEIRSLGFKGNLSSFYEWFNKSFPSYRERHRRGGFRLREEEVVSAKVDLLSARRLSIHVSNPQWGIDRESGECSDSFVIAERMISHSAVLSDLREVSVSFSRILRGSCVDELMLWIDRYSDSPYQKVRSFVNGLKRDLASVRNAILYRWSNGCVEGVVYRIKVK